MDYFSDKNVDLQFLCLFCEKNPSFGYDFPEQLVNHLKSFHPSDISLPANEGSLVQLLINLAEQSVVRLPKDLRKLECRLCHKVYLAKVNKNSYEYVRLDVLNNIIMATYNIGK